MLLEQIRRFESVAKRLDCGIGTLEAHVAVALATLEERD